MPFMTTPELVTTALGERPQNYVYVPPMSPATKEQILEDGLKAINDLRGSYGVGAWPAFEEGKAYAGCGWDSCLVGRHLRDLGPDFPEIAESLVAENEDVEKLERAFERGQLPELTRNAHEFQLDA